MTTFYESTKRPGMTPAALIGSHARPGFESHTSSGSVAPRHQFAAATPGWMCAGRAAASQPATEERSLAPASAVSRGLGQVVQLGKKKGPDAMSDSEDESENEDMGGPTAATVAAVAAAAAASPQADKTAPRQKQSRKREAHADSDAEESSTAAAASAATPAKAGVRSRKEAKVPDKNRLFARPASASVAVASDEEDQTSEDETSEDEQPSRRLRARSKTRAEAGAGNGPWPAARRLHAAARPTAASAMTRGPAANAAAAAAPLAKAAPAAAAATSAAAGSQLRAFRQNAVRVQHSAFNANDRELVSGQGAKWHRFSTFKFASKAKREEYELRTGGNIDTGVSDVSSPGAVASGATVMATRRGSLMGGHDKYAWRMSSHPTSVAAGVDGGEDKQLDTYKIELGKMAARATNTRNTKLSTIAVLADAGKPVFDPASKTYQWQQAVHAQGISATGLDKALSSDPEALYAPGIKSLKGHLDNPPVTTVDTMAKHSEPMAGAIVDQVRAGMGLPNMASQSGNHMMLTSVPYRGCNNCARTLNSMMGPNHVASIMGGQFFGGESNGLFDEESPNGAVLRSHTANQLLDRDDAPSGKSKAKKLKKPKRAKELAERWTLAAENTAEVTALLKEMREQA